MTKTLGTGDRTLTVAETLEPMDKFKQLQSLVGIDAIKKVLQASAIEAINSGNWNKVRTIAEFAIEEGFTQPRSQAEPADIDPISQIKDFIGD
jgi:hypothetical protein